jgi:heme/copper-type cytochrome/quinol oxidase subunit 2
MNKEKIITEILRRLKRGDLTHDIKSYLKSIDLTDEQSSQYIKDVKDLKRDKKRIYLTARNKILFGLFSVISVSSFIGFFFILPKYGFTNTTILSIIGAIIFVLSTLFALFSFRSWNKDLIEKSLDVKAGNKEGSFSVIIAISLIPIVIVYFLFSWHFESSNKNFLKDTQVETIGTVISGSSYKSRRLDFSELKISFKTKEGKTIVATKELYNYEFKKYNKGQKVTLIYSSKNPQIIELMNNSSRIKDYKNSEERSITPLDLIKLIDIPNNNNNIKFTLNSISYGWDYDDAKLQWKNPQKMCYFSKDDHEIRFLTKELSIRTFPKFFKQLDFTETTKSENRNPLTQKERRFENEMYKATINHITIENNRFYLTVISKK